MGYSARFVTERPTRIAVINAGYADGISRLRTNRGYALVRGQRVPLVGTISMDLTTLDVTDVPGVTLGDVVTIYGRDGKDSIVVSDVAAEIGTVTSDLLCALGRRVPSLLPLCTGGPMNFPLYLYLIDSGFPLSAILTALYSFICMLLTGASSVFIKPAEGNKTTGPNEH